MQYRTTVRSEQIGSLRFQFTCLENFEDSVDDLFQYLESKGEETKLDRLCPYFGVLWPGARALARWIFSQGTHAFYKKKILELGCGLALPSFVAARLGGHVTASDLHPHVPLFLASNLALNPGLSLGFQHLDWSSPKTSLGQLDWIVASDVLYESHHPASLIRFVRSALSVGGQAVILDPDRSYWRNLLLQAKEQGLATSVHDLIGQTGEPFKSVLIQVWKKKKETDGRLVPRAPEV